MRACARRVAAIAACGLFASSGVAMASPQAAPCHFLKTDAGTPWPSGFTGPAGSSLAGNVDLTSLDVSGDTSQVTVRIGVRDLSQQDPLGTAGVQYDVRAEVAMKRIHLDADTQATGNVFYAFVENLDESTGEPATVQTPGSSSMIKGALDFKASTITLTAPLSVFGFHDPLTKGRDIKKWVVSSYRMAGNFATGGADLAGDHAGTKRVYKLGDDPCGRIQPL
jgi:hypothetical protein